MTQQYTNIAFISYKREDEKWAKWLQKKLEHYKLPTEIRKQNPNMDFAENPRHVFKDTTDLSGGVLAKVIKDGLDSSKYLIVICSPRAAKSEWVCKEVQDFIDSGREEFIIPFIIEGEPYADNSENECFPAALKMLAGERELLGVNINENGRDMAAVKVVARLFELKFDVLWNRFQREEKRRKHWLIGSLFGAVIFLATILVGGIWSYNEIRRTNQKMLVNQSRFVAEKATQIASDGDSYLATLLLLNTMPTDLLHPNRPLVEESVQAMYSMKKNAILRGHADKVFSASYSADGKRIVSASYDNTIRIWDSENGQCIKVLETRRYDNSASFSPDGKRIVSFSYDQNTIHIWDAESGMCLNEIKEPSEDNIHINSVSFSYNSKFLVSTHVQFLFPGPIRIWDVESGECLKEFIGHTLSVTSASFSMDGKRLVSSSHDNTVRIWDIESEQCIKVLNGHNKDVYSAFFSPNGSQILSSDGDTIRIWDIESGECIKEFEGHVQSGTPAPYSPDGRCLVSYFRDSNIIYVWDVESGARLKVFKGHEKAINSVSFSPDGMHIVSASDDETIRIWETDSKDYLRILNEHEGDVYSAFFIPDGKQIISAAADNIIRIWDTENGICRKVFKEQNYGVNMASSSPDGTRIVVACDDNIARVLDAYSGICLLELKGHTSPVISVSFSPDGERIVSSSYEDGTIRIWDAESGVCLIKIEERTPNRFSVFFSPDGKNIVSIPAQPVHIASRRKPIRIWDAESGKCMKEIAVGKINNKYMFPFVTFASYSPDAKHIVSSYSDGIIRIWDVANCDCLFELKGHRGKVHSVSFSPDGKQIVSASEDGTLRIWDSQNGQCRKILKGDMQPLKCVSYSPNGKYIVSISDNNTIQIWNSWLFEDMFYETQKRFKNRNLTPDERRLYYLE